MNFLGDFAFKTIYFTNVPNKEPTIVDASAPTDTSRETCQAHRDLSWEREAREAALATLIAETVAREIAKANRKNCITALPDTLRINSGVNGFKVMDPFDWTQDRNIFQCWQLWSERTKHALKIMEGDTEEQKISYFHHWINHKGMEQISNWKNSKVLLTQEDLDTLPEEQKQDKYFSEKVENYFMLFDSILLPRSNNLLAVEELKLCKQGSMTAGGYHGHVSRIAQRCQFPCTMAKERGIRDAIFLGMNSQHTRDKCINLMNEQGKEVTVEFLLQYLEVEDYNAHHRSLSQLDSTGTGTWLHTTVGRTKPGAINQNKLVERTGIHRELSHLILQILHVRVETPRNGGQMYEMW